MKKPRFLTVLCLAVVCACVSLAAIACGPAKTPKTPVPSDWEVLPENTNPNLKYFGYFHSDGFHEQASYIDEIASLEHTNVLMLNSSGQTAEKLEKAKSLGMKAIIGGGGYFRNGQTTVANSATLSPTYKEEWEEYCEIVGPYVEDGTILGFYYDEPAWNGYKQEDFRTVTKMIRDTYPTVKMITTMTVYDIGVAKYKDYPELDKAYNEYCTDIMYDAYGSWNDEQRAQYLAALKTKGNDDAWIWGCPRGFSENPEQTGEIVKALKGQYAEALNDERFVGIVVFSYANGVNYDWGYGMHDFLNSDSDYYDRDLRKLVTSIGREVIGLEPFDYSKDFDIVLQQPYEVYEIGEKVPLPGGTIIDDNGNYLTGEFTLTDPDGMPMEVGEFVAAKSGQYTLTLSYGDGAAKKSKSVHLSVRYPNEISAFDSPAYLSDAGGTADDIWCWPREMSAAVTHSGDYALHVIPHRTDGEWPRVIFEHGGSGIWDVSGYGKISMWVYNNGDTAITDFSIMIAGENNEGFTNTKNNATVTLAPQVWTNVVYLVEDIVSQGLDPTKVRIAYGRTGPGPGGYKNRADFFIDDVMLLGDPVVPPVVDPMEELKIGFESASDALRIYGTDSDTWCWPRAISSEKAHGGTQSLKVTPHATDGTWMSVQFGRTDSETWDLSETNFTEISFWIYADVEIPGLRWLIKDGEGREKLLDFTVTPGEWTEIVITKEQILTVTDMDLSTLNISMASYEPYNTVKDRANFYVDDFAITLAD